MIMELSDSTGSDCNLNVLPHNHDARSGLGIDLNEIPSPSASFPETLPDSVAVDVVRAYHDNPAPPLGGPAVLPRAGPSLCAACSKPAAGSHHHLVVCDGCERGFHLACAGIHGGGRQAASLDDWVCGECVAAGVKSKRWALGVKQLLDINAPPPSEAEGDGVGDAGEVRDLRKHTPGDNSFGANPFRAPVTNSNFYNGNAIGFQKASGVVTHAVRLGFEDILNHTQSITRSFEEVHVDFPLGVHSSSNTAIRIPSQIPNEIFLQALRDFISERRGVLEEGWRVEFRQSVSNSELCAVYCAPDGKMFDSVYEVACYLGLTSGYNSVESELRNERSLPSLGGPLSRKRKSTRTPVANGFMEKQGTLINTNCKDPPSDGLNVECASARGNILKSSEIGSNKDGFSHPQQSADGLPLQFKDFFVLSLGKADERPSYYDVNLICPVGFKSCWHDKITGSLFSCEVCEGGDSGPIFRIQRLSCSEFPIPVGSTILSMSKLCQDVSQTNEEIERKTDGSMDLDNDESIHMMLLDPCVATENDILSCFPSCSIEACDTRTSDLLHPVASSVQDNVRNSLADNLVFNDGIGEILVEERSSFSAWRVISLKLVNACKDIYKQKGTLKFFCNHVENETCLHKLDLRNGKIDTHFTALDKFCGSVGLVGIPDVIYEDNDLEGIYDALGKWLEQDRFGLDVEFVQEVLEQLPGVQDSLQYEFLKNRNNSLLPTVENGFLEVEWRDGSKYQEVVQGLYRRSKKMTEKSIKEGRCPPLGKALCSRAPCELIGDIFQAWELLKRFHEILDLKEPLSVDDLEKELINPWFDESDFVEKSERDIDESLVLISQGSDGNCRPLLSPRCETHLSVSTESSHAFVEVETGAMKEAAQVKLASFTYARCFGVVLTKAHISLLRVLIGELLSKVAALVDPNSEPGESRTRRGRRKDMDSAVPAKRTKLNMLPINELTWPELAHRYILSFLSMDGNLESAEITARESGKVFRCLRGDGGLLCGSLTGVAGMEADALLLAEATKKIFGTLSRDNDVLTMEEESDAKGASEKNLGNDGNLPEWAQMLEPVRKLPTNVGTRIRKCVYDALEKDPPEWARKILEHSISKEVYKGNASGPTKKAVLSVLANVGEGLQLNPNKGQKKKIVVSISDIIMKQCRIVLRRAAAADDSKVFCNLLGSKLTYSSDNDDEGLLGSPAMVARPLDFRTIDLRLAAGAYGGSHESFLEDVRELWSIVRVAFGDQLDLVELAEKLSENFESLYSEEVVSHVQKLGEYAKLECLSAEMRKEVDDFIESTNEIPKAPWDEGVCKVCGIDRDDDSVLLCDTCDAEYHTYCLNPPLARIPEGNWYCPSCVDGHQNATQVVTGHTQIIGKHRSKKFQGEVNSLYLESLTHLSAVIEEKEYWECSVGERTFLLKFLCDELLNSSLIRQHLEQCTELSGELHQKLRAHSAEWKSLKTREDILSTKVAKIDTFSLNTAGEVGLKEGFSSLISNTGKCIGQSHNAVDNPSNFGAFVDCLPSEEITKEKYRLDNVYKSISVTNSDSDSKNMNCVDVEEHFKHVSGAVESQCTDKSPKSFRSPNHMSQEINGVGGAAHVQGNNQKCEGREISTPVTNQQGVPVDVHQIAVNDSELYHLELNAIKRDISLLQDTITSVVSQLLKLSVRREFLGIDSIGRLYWALALPGGRSHIVVDASAALMHGREMSFSRDYVQKFSVLRQCALSGKDSSLMPQPSNALDNGSLWIAYETDAEIEELLGWLDDNDPKERELKDSIMQGPKSRFQEFINAQPENQVEDQGHISRPRNREQTACTSLVTKATSLLEKKFGPFAEWDNIEVLMKQNRRSRTANDEKLYRCECLEPIWPSRKHCTYCHKTVVSDLEFDGHSDGKCNADFQDIEKNKDKNGSKGRGNIKCNTSQEKFRADAETAVTSVSGCSKLSSRLIKFSNEESTCPFNFEDICSKFVTNDSNKELVRDIGLIGLDGIASFVPSASPFVSEYTLSSAQKDESMVGSESKASESQVSQGNTDGAGTCLNHKSGISTGKMAAIESNGSNKSSLRKQKDGKFSFCSPALDMGVNGCCVVPLSSLRPLVGKVSHILRQLKINLLDMDAALPANSLRPSKAESNRRQAWRAFVKSAETIYEMIQATFTLEDMIKTEYLRNDWWYWSSFSAAAKSSTLPSLALRIYSLDLAIIYEKTPNSSFNDSCEPSAIAEPKSQMNVDAEKSKASRKSNRKRKESDV